jgi:undecaprenyl-diphosphatase
MFTVVIQLGAILAVVVYYWERLHDLVVDFFSGPRDKNAASHLHVPRWRHPLVLVLAAVAPAGLVGVLLKQRIDELMEYALPIGLALVGGAVAIEVIERLCRGRGRVTDVTGVSPGQALGIGIAQVLALIPGVSRSAATIMGGRVCNLNLPAAADFSFLLSIPTMAIATVFSLYKHRLPLDLHQVLVLTTGFLTAFVVALLVVVWFLRYVQSHSFRLFVVYRLAVGLAIIAAWACGWFG